MLLRKKKGFTLVELLVVVAIISILSAAIIPNFLGYTEKARVARASADMRSIQTVLEAYAVDKGQGEYPVNDNDTTNPKTVAFVLQESGIKWTGENDGITDPWGNPYFYSQVEEQTEV